MKKLIINEKNLQKIAPKLVDSNIRIRTNKAPSLGQPSDSPKKRTNPSLHDIQQLIQSLQNNFSKHLPIQQEYQNQTILYLKCLSDKLKNHEMNMTQPFKLKKIKLKTGNIQDKQNQSGISPILCERFHKIADRFQNDSNDINKIQQPVQNLKINNTIHSPTQITQNCQIEQNGDLILSYRYSEIQSRSLTTSRLLEQSQKDKIIDQYNKKYLQKIQQITQLNERLSQLSRNVENLIKKNSQKTQQLNKIQQMYIQSQEKLKISVKQIKTLQKKKKYQQVQKIEKLDQQIGRYQTAQKFYQLTRTDLAQQNQQLLSRLKERQSQLKLLYQTLNKQSTFIQNQYVNKLNCTNKFSESQDSQDTGPEVNYLLIFK